MSSPGRLLKEALATRQPVRVMAAHSPLSARLVEEAGFDAIWGSGFEFSALMGLPDMSLVSMTQHLDMLRAIAAATDLPVVADIDTGYGNALNVMHAVQEFERAGVGAVVIEDKVFPKTTSLVAGGRQELLSIDEFQGKIEAAVNARSDPDFLVVARDEALIAGHGEAEALGRARSYVEAGADLILIHSKRTEPDEIESFVRAWDGRVPLVIVPTAYPQMTEARAAALKKIGMFIYGNHAIRAAVTAMQAVFAKIIAEGGIEGVNDEIVPVAEVFRLQKMDDVKSAERRFLR